MAERATQLRQAGATPGKLALIGVLAVVLLGVLYVQFGPGGAADPPASPERPSRGAAARNRPPARSEPAPHGATRAVYHISPQSLERWRPPELDEVVQYDPFALPASFPQPPSPQEARALAGNEGDDPDSPDSEQQETVEQRLQQYQVELEKLRQLGVQVVLGKQDQFVAMIGDRTVHVGDQIGGFTVIAIDPDGVRIALELTP